MLLSTEEIRSELTNGVPWLRPDDALDQICRVASEQSCSRVTIQQAQPCKELRAMHDAFYDRLFRRYRQVCDIAHFFAEERYLGYCKFYPVAGSTIGETALSFADRQSSHLACWRHVPRETGGFTHHVVAAPFIQQESNCGVCAQAALWMALKVIGPSVGKRDITIPEITELAGEIQATGPTMPSSGLYWDQLTHVVRRLGYSPLLYSKPDGGVWYPDGLVYRLIESGLPAVLGLEGIPQWNGVGHVVAAVGHKFHPMGETELPDPPSGYHTPATFMRSFLVNDDNIGPYREMPSRPEYAVPDGLAEGQTPYNLQEHVKWILGILPPEVTFFAEDAEAVAFGFLRRVLGLSTYAAMAAQDDEAGALVEAVAQHRLVLRTFLLNRRRWRRERLEKKGVVAVLHDAYRALELPEHVWVVEISTAAMYNAPGEQGERRIMGEVIVDPTAVFRSTEAVLLLHVPGSLVTSAIPRNPDSGYVLTQVPGDGQYLGCLRLKERRAL